MVVTSMVVLIIDKFSIGANKPECDTPVAIDPNRPMPFNSPFNGCNLNEGKFMSDGPTTTSSRPSIFRVFFAWEGWMPRVVPDV